MAIKGHREALAHGSTASSHKCVFFCRNSEIDAITQTELCFVHHEKLNQILHYATLFQLSGHQQSLFPPWQLSCTRMPAKDRHGALAFMFIANRLANRILSRPSAAVTNVYHPDRFIPCFCVYVLIMLCTIDLPWMFVLIFTYLHSLQTNMPLISCYCSIFFRSYTMYFPGYTCRCRCMLLFCMLFCIRMLTAIDNTFVWRMFGKSILFVPPNASLQVHRFGRPYSKFKKCFKYVVHNIFSWGKHEYLGKGNYTKILKKKQRTLHRIWESNLQLPNTAWIKKYAQ